ncbi:hypothetical protein [Streptomyces armeniacus]|uniref:hypothetical protein n=1 Tax=Streptomyces armeniacus TaxID=83291 RepID=UPI001AD7E6D8|nr:hypothetical protein [Streptomyces armeniacus]
MELDAVADELYGLPPRDFTAARDRRAKEARSAGDGELAARIRGLRRPTLAAWASNLLVREAPGETGPLLRLGQALRNAHQELDGAQLRELSARQHQVISALARQAAELAEREGQRLGEAARREVEQTLHAALADPDAGEEWARGRLAKPLTATVGFPGVAAETGPTSRPSGGGKRNGSRERDGSRGRTRTGGTARSGTARAGTARSGGRARDGEEKRGSAVADLDVARTRRRERQQRLDEARARAEEAERELGARTDDRDEARDAADRAEERQRQAERQAEELARQLKEAESEHRTARDATRKARERLREAERETREARRRYENAASRADRLARQSGGAAGDSSSGGRKRGSGKPVRKKTGSGGSGAGKK